jgi:hypothetical protein
MGSWHYQADVMTACNCDWGCPCNFNARPTQGFCEGGWALKISEGRCNDVRLNGLGFAMMAKWPRAIHEGNGTAKIWIDASATAEQRHALDEIIRGKLGGPPWIVFAATVDHWLDTAFVAMEWHLDGSRSRVSFGEEIRLSMQPMRNPVTGKETPARIVLPQGIMCKELNMTASETFSVFTPGLKYAWPGLMSWYGSVEHQS